ncbi:GM16953 [Drosophila sechellia]|uniref:GM16953 n=1 Tax=Drosophila sechellia TaxID=7238 RepID=B4IMD3_DROSE|nr:GM16953 [Drosophila sechellia]
MGKNVYTEIKCNNLLSLDDIVTIICHPLCMPEVKEAYVDFLNHCYIDTEVEMKEIYASGHMWSLFEKSFLVDINQLITNPTAASNKTLQAYVLNGVTNLLGSFFASPFSDQSAIVQSRQLIFVQMLQAAHGITQCRWLSLGDCFNVENCIRTLTESSKMRSIALPAELEQPQCPARRLC